MYFINFYVPAEHLETVKEAMFAAGAGKVGGYEKCCWQTKGEGQFLPLTGSDPYSGEIGKVEHAAEWKVEMVCEEGLLKKVVNALLKAHPYETPAYQVFKMENV